MKSYYENEIEYSDNNYIHIVSKIQQRLDNIYDIEFNVYHYEEYIEIMFTVKLNNSILYRRTVRRFNIKGINIRNMFRIYNIIQRIDGSMNKKEIIDYIINELNGENNECE